VGSNSVGRLPGRSCLRLLFDRPTEPSGNLDTQSSQEIISIFHNFNWTDGLTILVVIHEPDIAAYASRQIVMKDGCIVSDYPLVALDAGVS
jgi:ABC-type lipoprotein export system ATPase subunit